MKRAYTGIVLLLLLSFTVQAQLKWVNVDADFAPLPANVHVYKTTDSLDGKPNIAFYVEAKLKDKQLHFTTDTTYKRRFTPTQFYEKNNHPLVVVNTTFFSFATNQNLNVVIKDGKLVSYNVHTIAGRGKDTLTYRHPLGSAIGISKKRKVDVAWLYADSSLKQAVAFETKPLLLKDSFYRVSKYDFVPQLRHLPKIEKRKGIKDKWKVQTAVGGGPVLVQDGKIKITNNEELKFAGKAIEDKHPRTCMGYTGDGKLIIMVIQGRFPGIAEGATLTQQAKMLIDLGCVEALNLDGGGSSCMLVNGKETIKPSDAAGERAVPAVFIIK
ncbi:phosphodiester glycosidase family protein [Ferruginibacter sp.]|nr:phosphodiester glycosidase family protein [Ferruginibacter sp.]